MITIFKDYNFELEENNVDNTVKKMNEYLGVVYEIAKELNDKTDKRLTMYHTQSNPTSFDIRIAVKLPKSAVDPTPIDMVMFSIDPYDDLLMFGNRTKAFSNKEDLKKKIARVFELKSIKSFIEEANLYSKKYKEDIKKYEEKKVEMSNEEA